MSVDVKICGLSTEATLQAAIDAGAKFTGFVFYPPSPRAVTADQAAKLVRLVPPHVTPVGLFVDPSDDLLALILAQAPLRMIQLHGDETPERVAQIRQKTGLSVMKVIKVGAAVDVAAVGHYGAVADWLMFDAQPQVDDKLPGGNARRFDWNALHGIHVPKPWMLAGGLNVGNLADAVRVSGAKVIDVSSGVEDTLGQKNPQKIRDLIALARNL